MKRKTYAVLIGNSDDKLSQVEWSGFMANVRGVIVQHASVIHFAGCALPDSRFQNACLVFEATAAEVRAINFVLLRIKQVFKQDSIALVQVKTIFL